MTALSKPAMAILTIAMVVVLTTFSGVSFLKLTAMGVGMILILLGILYSYRQPAAIGLLIVSATAAASTELTTLLELDALLMAMIGLLIPIAILAWIALTTQDEEAVNEVFARRPVVLTTFYGVLCLLSIPIVLFVTSLFFPGISMRTTTMTEAAIMLIAAITGGVFVTIRGTAPTSITASSKKKE